MSSPTAPARRLAVGLAFAVGASTISVVVAPASPAAANIAVSNEVFRVTGSDVLKLEGHGWGHGHGMSQHGALGAAQLDKTADQITAFYYPGTAKATVANPPVRVLLKADADSATEVYPATGLKVADIAARDAAGKPVPPTTLPTTLGATRWRALTTANGLQVQYYAQGVWKRFKLNNRTEDHVGPIQFSGPAVIRLEQTPTTVNGTKTYSSRDYRGVIRAVRRSATVVHSINILSMELYLRGVVPRESPSSWPAAALQAQSIAARSYSHYKRDHIPAGQHYDICDTVMCQVYGGVALYDGAGKKTAMEATSTTNAIVATAQVVRTYQGKAIFAEFSSSNGGWSTKGDFPYLIPQRDTWDGVTGSSVHYWKATVSAAQIQLRFPAVGRLLRMRITERDGNGDWGGRVQVVVLEGVDSAGNPTTVNTTGRGIYGSHVWPTSSTGMRSSWWRVIPIYTAALGAVTSTQPGSSTGAPGSLLAGSRTVVVPITKVSTLRVAVRNSGNVTWPVTSGGPVRLGTSGPRDRTSESRASSWRSANRVSSVTAGAPVAPGQSGTFSLPLAGNSRPIGVTKEAFEPTWDGRSWISGAVLSLTVVRVNDGVSRLAMVDLAPAAKVSLTNAPNAQTTLTVRMRNLGRDAWSVGKEQLKPGSATTSWAPTTPTLSRNVTRPKVAAVYPGEIGEWRVPLSGARKTPGTYELTFRPATPTGSQYGPTVRTSVTVVEGTFTGTLVASSGSVTVPRTGTVTTWFDVKNTGNAAWPLRSMVRSATLTSGGSPSKASICAAGTFGPACWVANYRPGPVTANRSRPTATDVRPGEVARFAFVLAGNNRTPRTTSEPFGVIWESWKRLPNLSVSLPYTVGS